MNRRDLLWIAPWMLIGLSACTAYRPALRSAGRPETAKACADWRWIGITSKPGVQCPQVPGWTVTPLFGQVAPPPDACDKPVVVDAIRELSRFCVYETADKWKARPFPPAVSADLVRFDQDCAALALSLDADLKANQWKPSDKEYFKDFPAQAGKPKDLHIAGRPSVRLSFLDTQRTGGVVPTVQGHSRHGYTLARLAHSLVCEEGDRCAAQITTRLALPIMYFNGKSRHLTWIDTEGGGLLGLQSHLAQAIRDEVDGWWNEEGHARHLVLNLSTAWDGKLFDGLDQEQISDMRAGTQAVYDALQYAAGYDVLVLAAAGNQKRQPCESYGPLLPAAWEVWKERAPQGESCGERRKEPPPLLYAVGGVQANNSPLANARRGGMPQRAAYGETEIFSGSSVATAVASSIAAVVWNTYPDLTSSEVMQSLDEGGRELKLAADFWSSPALASPAPKVRKLSLCTALAKAEKICQARGLSHCLNPTGEHEAEQKAECDRLQELAEPSVEVAPATPGSCQPWLWPQPEAPPFPHGPPYEG
jgi:hypothetical protein